ncbi:TIGR00341 family protein [Waterburya agarophytonicola K14]|uniref:TIGR00341 family protein n=1 Tax=Waterburya agarophytonicola KI4 TaxID=2874699 RepID=A0A964BS43_9CYAN|nr:TIGR00341 family protein [Waterburya agarophytonicola]MCC0178654.1 TIGR00341 family protein [Waterburya agarophytonicola KI4]
MLLLNPNLGWYTRLKLYFRQRYPVQAKKIEESWNSQSGDWHWLAEKPLPIVTLNRNLWRSSVPSLSFYVLLGLSGLIATLGLLANSVAIIIGAMIIAPLIGPITGIAYSSTVANRRLLKRSFLTLSTGVLFTVFISAVTVLLIGLKSITPEIIARTNPNLLDLVIALAAGAAGAFANTRKRIADALPGVAIAVALVPPLSVVGIGIAWGSTSLSIGALLLFITNLTGIIFSGVIILLLQSYGSIERAKQGLIFTITTLIILGLPLGLSLKGLILQNNVRYEVNEIVRNKLTSSDIRSTIIKPDRDNIAIEMEIVAQPNSIDRSSLIEIRKDLVNKLNKEVELEVKIIPVETITIDD